MDDLCLDDIFFGKADGMQESKRKDFIDLFYDGNNTYGELENDESKFIISGRKGTGKTILARYYGKKIENNGGISNIINGNDILLSHIKEIGEQDIEDRQLAAFTKYTLLIEIAKMIINKKNLVIRKAFIFRKIKCIKAIKELSDLVEDRNANSNFGITNFCKKAEIATNAGMNNSIINAGLNAKTSVEKNFEKNKYFTLLDMLENNIKIIAKDIRIAMIVDDMDEYRSDTYNDKNFYLFLSKMIETTAEINEDLFNVSPTKKSKVVLLIRSDFIDALQAKSSNINKTIMDSQILLNWLSKMDEEKPENNILMDLILTKIKHSNDKLNRYTTRELYELLFPEKIGNISTIKYIFNVGHGRPRDVINLLNLTRKVDPKASCFSKEMFNQSQKEYSRCFKDEIRNEMAIFYPANKIDECFRIITLLKKTSFCLTDVSTVLKDYSKQISNVENEDEFITIMYNAGVIGNCWKNGNIRRYSFKYREDGNENPDFMAKFTVHIGLRKDLLKL